MTTPNIEELIAKLRTSMGDLDCPNTYEFAMHQAADALQSQAEHIAELESLNELAVKQAETLVKQRDTLRAQLAAIRAQEPVLVVEKEPDYWSGGHFHEGSKPHIKPTKVWCLPIGTQLFTHPMPAQDVTELVDAFEYHIEQTRPIERSTIALSKYKGAK